MIKKHQRLSGKDIQFLLRRGQKLYGSSFVLVRTDQHPKRQHHQRSIQIPVKLDKRATMRNLLKRKALEEFHVFISAYQGGYKKFFMFLNKQELQPLGELIATSDKTTIVQQRSIFCKHDFSLFFTRLGTLGLKGGTMHGMHGKKL